MSIYRILGKIFERTGETVSNTPRTYLRPMGTTVTTHGRFYYLVLLPGRATARPESDTCQD